MDTISSLLDELWDIESKQRELEFRLRKLFPKEYEELDHLHTRIESLRLIILAKSTHVYPPHTIRGRYKQLVWNRSGRWNTTKLENLAVIHNIPLEELHECKGDGFYSIRDSSR